MDTLSVYYVWSFFVRSRRRGFCDWNERQTLGRAGRSCADRIKEENWYGLQDLRFWRQWEAGNIAFHLVNAQTENIDRTMT